MGILAYLSWDRPDLQFTVKTLSRALARPHKSDEDALKRAVRYIMGHSKLGLLFAPSDALRGKLNGGTEKTEPVQVDCYCDADCSGRKSSSKSTSGAICFLGGCPILSFSRRQATIALSSAESELYAMVSGAAEALYVQAVLVDLNIEAKVVLHTDSTAGKAIIQRSGVGKVRH